MAIEEGLEKLKKRTYEILELAKPGDRASRIFDFFIISLIILNVIAVILETVGNLSVSYAGFFKTFEIISVIIFSIEYLLRVWSCVVNEKFKAPIKGRIKFILIPLALIDLFAVLPFYLPMLIPIDLRFIRALRLFRLFRLFKLSRYSEGLHLLGRVLKNKKEELFIALFVTFLLLIVSSSLLYYVEHEHQPDVFSSIPAAMWWGIATLTTVGYGDIYPVTTLGKFLGSIISLLGIGLFAMPTGIISAGFVEESRKRKKQIRQCPHCGKNIE